MKNELKVGDTIMVPMTVVDTTSQGVGLYCSAMDKVAFASYKAIAAWNARAGSGVPVGYVAVYPDGAPYTNHLFNDDNDPQLSPSANVRLVPVYTHPAPAVDAGEVERLVDAVIDATDRYRAIASLGMATPEEREEAKDKVFAARAALIEHVTGKGER